MIKMKCINCKARHKKGILFYYCTLKKESIDINLCKTCKNRRYPKVKPMKQTELKKVSKKHAKSERERYSIITNDLEHCIENKNHTGHIDKHEAFRGCRRGLCKKWGLVLPLCEKCHSDPKIELKWKIKGQLAFMKHYNKTEEEFVEIFKINFLKKHQNLQ
jgi:hypothetical protein